MKQTFTLTITGTEHGEWQGSITGESGKPDEFQSVLTLLKTISKKLEEARREDR